MIQGLYFEVKKLKHPNIMVYVIWQQITMKQYSWCHESFSKKNLKEYKEKNIEHFKANLETQISVNIWDLM